MFGEFFRFELKYQLRYPLVWIVALLFGAGTDVLATVVVLGLRGLRGPSPWDGLAARLHRPKTPSPLL